MLFLFKISSFSFFSFSTYLLSSSILFLLLSNISLAVFIAYLLSSFSISSSLGRDLYNFSFLLSKSNSALILFCSVAPDTTTLFLSHTRRRLLRRNAYIVVGDAVAVRLERNGKALARARGGRARQRERGAEIRAAADRKKRGEYGYQNY